MADDTAHLSEADCRVLVLAQAHEIGRKGEEIERLDEEIERLRAALAPFAAYAKDQIDYRLPKMVADDGTPVLGKEYEGRPTIYVGDLKRAAEFASQNEDELMFGR